MSQIAGEVPGKRGTSSKIFYGWWVVAASVLGIAIGPGQFAFGSLGLGSRRIVVPSVAILGTLLVSIGLFTSELWHLYLIFAMIGTIAAGSNSLPYMNTVSTWFDKRRGLAIGLTMTGAGLGYA